MNLFINPIHTLPFLKNYLTIPKRIFKKPPDQIKKINDKSFVKIFRYAYNVPVYHSKYKKAGISIGDIKGIDDISKLPFITKKELIGGYPNEIIPRGYNKDKGFVVSTGGSSGKPVSLYTDIPTMLSTLVLCVRQGLYYDFNLRKIKIANIGTHLPGRIDYIFNQAITQKTSFFRKNNSYICLNAFDPMMEIIKKLDEFRPDIIYTYPITLQHIAYLIKKGYGPHIKPKILQVSGYSLDEYTRKYVEDVFNCKMVNLYQSVEASGDIAVECKEGTWHINYDHYYLETIDENMEVVNPGERGHIVLTRLFGYGTPFIRYIGMDDWVTLLDGYECNCGVCTPVLKHGVEGRVSARIILPSGRVYPAASFAIISLVLKELNTYKVIRFQIIQNKIDDIEIRLVIDEDLRDKGPSVDLIFKKIKEAYEKKCGPGVKITVKEVKEIKSPKGKPQPLVISKVKLEDAMKLIES